MTTTIKTHEDYKAEAIDNFARNFLTLLNCQKQYNLAREAAEANNEKFGYTAKYGEPGYVEYKDRDAGWTAIDRAVSLIYDANSDAYSEAESNVTWALSTLTYHQQKAVTDLVVGFLAENKAKGR